MVVIEKPSLFKFFLGIILSVISSITCVLLLGPNSNSSNLIWILPGLTFGLALIIPNINCIEKMKWKIVSIIIFPIILLVVWYINLFFFWTIGSAISEIFGLKFGLSFIGFYSSLTVFGALNFFFKRNIKLLNYLIVGILGAISFLMLNNIYMKDGEGLNMNFDKLIYLWQTFVGIGISLSYKTEKLQLFFE